MLGVCVCSKFNFESTDNNGTAVISRLAGGGRGPSVDLDLVAVPFSFFRGWLAPLALGGRTAFGAIESKGFDTGGTP